MPPELAAAKPAKRQPCVSDEALERHFALDLRLDQLRLGHFARYRPCVTSSRPRAQR